MMKASDAWNTTAIPLTDMPRSYRVNVTATPTLVLGAGTAGRSAFIHNSGKDPMYLGDENVTVASGYELLPGVQLPGPVYVWPGHDLYAIVETADPDALICVLEQQEW